jgi:hypothetical protein
MNKFLPVVAILLLLSAASCQKSELKEMVNTDSFVSVRQSAIASVNGPTTAAINQEVKFTVSWPYAGYCQTFKSFKAESLSDTTRIKLFTATNVAEDCTGKEVQRSSTFTFKSDKAGVYFLKFLGPDSARAIVDTLTVR